MRSDPRLHEGLELGAVLRYARIRRWTAESRDEIGLLAASAKAARAILAKRLPGKRCARPGANRISWQPFQVLPALPRFAAGAFLNAVDDARRSQCDGVFARLHILRCYTKPLSG